jgi:hypothetical protein
MKEVTAVQLRQSVSKVAHHLERGGGPVLLRLGRKPVGVIVSIDAYKEHFRRDQTAEREALMAAILGDRAQTDETIEEILDAVRGRR